MSLRKSERSQRRLRGAVFNQSLGRRLWDFQTSPLWDVSETLYETSQRCIWDASMPVGLIPHVCTILRHTVQHFIKYKQKLNFMITLVMVTFFCFKTVLHFSLWVIFFYFYYFFEKLKISVERVFGLSSPRSLPSYLARSPPKIFN